MEYNDLVVYDVEPSIEDVIIKLNAHKLLQFQAKLEEYRARDRARFERQTEERMAVDGVAELIRFNQQMVLMVILEIAKSRDTIANPIWMPEVATKFKQMTNIDVSKSLTVPLMVRRGTEGLWTMPDSLATEAVAGPEAAAFVDAYGLYCRYAAGRKDMIWGGTGLPEIEDELV